MEMLRDGPFYRDEQLFVDLRQQVVILDGEIVRLTRMEYRLLAVLVEHAGEIVPRTVILTELWGREIRTRRLDMHVSGLRRKLASYDDQCIETVVRVGYRFRPG